MLQNYARFTGDTVLRLGIPGGGTDVSTGMVLEGPGEAERRGEEEPQREGRETARETGAAAGRPEREGCQFPCPHEVPGVA